jgi:hypothetical protein
MKARDLKEIIEISDTLQGENEFGNWYALVPADEKQEIVFVPGWIHDRVVDELGDVGGPVKVGINTRGEGTKTKYRIKFYPNS